MTAQGKGIGLIVSNQGLLELLLWAVCSPISCTLPCCYPWGNAAGERRSARLCRPLAWRGRGTPNPLSLLWHGMWQSQGSKLPQDMQWFCSIWFVSKGRTRPAAGLGFQAWKMNLCWARRRNSTTWVGWHTHSPVTAVGDTSAPFVSSGSLFCEQWCWKPLVMDWKWAHATGKTPASNRDLDQLFISSSFYLSSLK